MILLNKCFDVYLYYLNYTKADGKAYPGTDVKFGYGLVVIKFEFHWFSKQTKMRA